MSTLRKLKAYFGMIPADEVDDYQDEFLAEEPGYRRSPASRYHHEFRSGYGDGYEPHEPYESYEPPRRRVPRSEPPVADREPERRPWEPAATPVRGSLAVEPQAEPVTRIHPAATPQQVNEELPLSKITTLHLHSYNEALKIGEPYRAGTPVIMNLTEMEDADAKRLVDFAVGLAFALRGDIDKITSKVFLLSPPDLNVTAEDKQRIAEGGFFGRR